MSKKDKADKKSKTGKKKDGKGYSLHSLTPAVTQVARALRTQLSRELAESGLYAGQDGVILALSQEDGQTPGALALRLGVKAPTMTRTIGRMESQGFLERRADEVDARLTKVFLTDLGRTSLEHIGAANAECERHATKGISGKELKQLVKLLGAIEANLAGAPQE